MAEGERVPGSTASLEGGADDSEAVSRFESRLEELFGGDPAGHVAIVHADDARLVFLASCRTGTSVEPVPFDVDLLVQLTTYRDHGFDAEFRNSIRRALAATYERQPALPGLDDLAGQNVGSSDRALLVSAAMLEGLGSETLSRLRDRIAEVMSATEVPIRALRNPGKVLSELAEKGQIARVTNHGKIVGWLMPATEAEQHVDDLLKQGRLRRGTSVPIEPIDIDGLERPLSEALTESRDRERS
ncbi:hypothetical protein HEP84_35715 [Streptomyces sp. RLB1-33]|nr:hypothetical protein [Streptomyces sp. RLB1-33]QIY73708.1 hypothetical protein HEP84_35715 [Streptomyces sp. RLB1-33]